MAVWKVFVGGAADSHSRIVEDYFIAYAAANPTLSCRYFSWEDRAALARLLNGEAKDGHVSLVGHSNGGDTCSRHAERAQLQLRRQRASRQLFRHDARHLQRN